MLITLSILGCDARPAARRNDSTEFAGETKVMHQAPKAKPADIREPRKAASKLREARDLDEILSLLIHAKSLAFSDIGRNECGLGVTTYPKTTRSAETIQKIAALIRDSRFTFDAETSEFLREGGAIDCMVSLEVKVDDTASFRIFTTKYLLAENQTIYVATRYPDTLDDNFVLRLNQILEEEAE
jgi:hypothetical protein